MREMLKRVSMDDLFGGLAESADTLAGSQMLPLAEIAPDPEQPRKSWPPESLEELAASIREQGILQPVLVRAVERNRYVLIAGERRWRAARMAGLAHIPAVVKDVHGPVMRVMSLMENLQREDLRDEEMAAALYDLKKLRRATWEEVARWVGLSEPRVKALAMLHREPPEIQALMAEGLSEKHASLTRVLKDGRRLQLLREALRRGLSTAQTREAVDLLRADPELSVAAALCTLLGAEEGNGSAARRPLERIQRTMRWIEKFNDEDADPEFMEALAALERQVRQLRRRLAGAVS